MEKNNQVIDKVKIIKEKTSDIARTLNNTVKDSIEDINLAIEEKRLLAEKEIQDNFKKNLEEIYDDEIKHFIISLKKSPIKLTDNKVKQIKKVFPIPVEQNILWADAEFDLRPSGIIATNKGIFIRSNVGIINEKSTLLYYDWNNFDPSWFISDNVEENKALLVEPQCYERFVETCKNYTVKNNHDEMIQTEIETELTDISEKIVKAGIVTGNSLKISSDAIFLEQNAAVNNPAGHGLMAEKANNLVDRLQGIDAKIVGTDNIKDGPDRKIGDVLIQSKYYNTPRGTLEAGFDSKTGMYRYMKDGKPMKYEVPKDQYEKVLRGFEEKIRKGKVPNVTDPKEAKNIVRKGKITYDNAVNLTKANKIESLTYDAVEGAISCSCAYGITFVITAFISYRKTKDIKKAIQAGTSAGVQVFGISFVQHMVVSQLARTSLASSLATPSQYIVNKIGYDASATIVNVLRALAGKNGIYGAAASKHLAKIMRNNMFTTILSFALFSMSDTYNLVFKKISGAQYMKNISIFMGSIAGAAGGTFAAGVATAKAASIAGTAINPGIGTAVGLAGGFVGGVVGSQVVKVTGNIIHEDDIEAYTRLFNAYVSYMIGENYLDSDEIDILINSLNNIKEKDFKKLFKDIPTSKNQEDTIRNFLNCYFEEIITKRDVFSLPSDEYITDAVIDLVNLT